MWSSLFGRADWRGPFQDIGESQAVENTMCGAKKKEMVDAASEKREKVASSTCEAERGQPQQRTGAISTMNDSTLPVLVQYFARSTRKVGVNQWFVYSLDVADETFSFDMRGPVSLDQLRCVASGEVQGTQLTNQPVREQRICSVKACPFTRTTVCTTSVP